MKRLLFLALTFSVRGIAQTPAPPPALIPVPRELSGYSAPVRLSGGVAISAGAEEDDLRAASIFAAQLIERGIAIDGGGSWKVEVLRIPSPDATRALEGARLTFDPRMRAEGYVLISDANGARVIAQSS